MEREPSGEEESRQRSEAEATRVQRFQFGPWLFNVNGARAIFAESPRETSRLPVEPWAHFYGLDNTEEETFSVFTPFPSFDRDYAMTTDLSQPVLVATLRSSLTRQFPLLVDGIHRLYRAYIEHVPELSAYVLSADESLAIREDGFIGSSIYWPSHDETRFIGGSGEPSDDAR